MNDALTPIRAALAERLGVTVKPGGLEGRLDGAPLQITLRIDRSQQHHHAVLDLKTGTVRAVDDFALLQVDVLLPFRPRLDAQLSVTPSAGWDVLRSASRTSFEERFALRGKEADRVDALVPPVARGALNQAFVGDPGPRVTDEGVAWQLRRASPWPTVDEIAEVVRGLPPAWVAIYEASRKLGPPSGLEEAMVHLAGLPLRPGLELCGCPAGIVGDIAGIGVEIRVSPRIERGWPVKIAIGLPSLLPGGPRVVRETRFGWLDRLGALLEGRSEIVVGDSKFDRRFAVRSLRPDLLKQALVPGVREAMLALDSILPIDLDSAGIDGATALPTLAGFDALVPAVITLAEALREGAG